MDAVIRVLLIDDDVKLGRLLREFLKPQGFAVDLSHTGRDGLHQALHGEYDAIILDVMLPEMNGYEVLRELRKQSSVPVLMLTALGTESDRISGLDVGADDYLPKTFSKDELSARLRALVRRSVLTARDYKELKEDRQDLDQAREIQRALLPKEIPRLEGYEISGAWLPAGTVGGDYYDVLRINKTKVAICIGDVSGKGMPAALLMANLQAAVKAFATSTISPAELCRKVNGILCANVAAGRYVTFFYGILDSQESRLTYTCAGHNPPALVRRDGSLIRLDEGGAVLGLFPEWEYHSATIDLFASDRLLLFTDGVSEAISATGEEFGEHRLFEISRNQADMDAADLQKAVIHAVSAHTGGNFNDDVTIVTVRVTGTT